MNKSNSNVHFGTEITETTRQRHSCQHRSFACRLLHRMGVNVEISSRTLNCQLCQLNSQKNYFLCSFQTNSAPKQTQGHCRYSLPYCEYLARKLKWSHVFFHLSSGLNFNAHLFYFFFFLCVKFSCLIGCRF